VSAEHNGCVPLVRQWLRAVEGGQSQTAFIRRRAIEEARWAACNLARHRRWAVHPCTLVIRSIETRAFDKPPTSPHGFLDATRDPDVVAELWRQYPGDLAGVRTGEASGESCCRGRRRGGGARHGIGTDPGQARDRVGAAADPPGGGERWRRANVTS